MGLGTGRTYNPWPLGTKWFHVFWNEDPPFVTGDWDEVDKYVHEHNTTAYKSLIARDELEAYTLMLREYGPPGKDDE